MPDHGKTKLGKGGKPPVDISEYFKLILPFLQIGCSLREACLEAGVPYTTVWDYVNDKDEVTGEYSEKANELRDMIDKAQNIPVVLARKAWVGGIQKGDIDASIEYLKRKRKDEFSEKIEGGGEAIKEIAIKFVN